jgi:ketosteroid isomerase-like protein
MRRMEPLPRDIESWLKAFSRAVRERDFASGKNLFERGVVSFGTVCFRVEGIDALAAKQWQAVWPNTENFEFDYASARAVVDAETAAVVAGWSSTGLTGNGPRFQRSGRSTLVLRRAASGWKAVHTHFSLAPAQSDDPLLRQAS